MFQYFRISIITSIHLYITYGCFWTTIVKLSSVRNCVVHKGKHIYSWSSIGKDCPPIELVYFLQIFTQFLKFTFHLQLLHNIEYIHHTGNPYSLSYAQVFVRPTPHPCLALVCSLYTWLCFFYVIFTSLLCFLDSTYKWYHSDPMIIFLPRFYNFKLYYFTKTLDK